MQVNLTYSGKYIICVINLFVEHFNRTTVMSGIYLNKDARHWAGRPIHFNLLCNSFVILN